MKYSEVELADAAKSVNPEGFYFKGLDWNNSDEKWCHAVTPWLNLYPQCWNNLYEVGVCVCVRVNLLNCT